MNRRLPKISEGFSKDCENSEDNPKSTAYPKITQREKTPLQEDMRVGRFLSSSNFRLDESSPKLTTMKTVDHTEESHRFCLIIPEKCDV